MTRFALILAVWLLAILTIVLLADEHRAENAGAPLVKSAAARPVWTIIPQCRATSRNLPRYIERIA